MKKSKFSLAFLLLIFTLALNSFSPAQSVTVSSNDIKFGNSLLRIFAETKVGFIDTTGKLIIPAKFANAFDFNEGLAAARMKSLYGFINTKGEFVIPPKYSYAEGFRNGSAVIFKDSTAGILYKDGREVLYPNYSSIKFICDTKAIVATHRGKKGIIDNKGTLVLDTIYNYIEDVQYGLFEISRSIPPDKFRNGVEYETALIDTSANFIFPFGKDPYVSMTEGYIITSDYPDSTAPSYRYIYNSKGKFLFKTLNFTWNSETPAFQYFSDSILIAKYFRADTLTDIKENQYRRNFYYVIINIFTGERVKNEEWNHLRKISENSIYAQFDNGQKGVVIDTHGKILIDTNTYSYLEIGYTTKTNIIAVSDKGTYAVFDNMGNELLPYQNHYIVSAEEFTNKFPHEFIYLAKVFDFNKSNYMLRVYGPDWKLKDTFQIFKFVTNKNGTISAYDSDFYYCLNRNYEVIYKSNLYGDENLMDIDYMREQDFKPRYSKDTIKLKEKYFNKNGLSLYLDEMKEVPYGKYFKGMNLYFINTTGKIVSIGNRDFVNIKLQAKDNNGDWKYIEGQFYSFIDFSFEQVNIINNGAYKTEVPVFNGDFKTKLRAELYIVNPQNERKMISVYSNEVDCRINETQFWRKQYHNLDYANPYLEIIYVN